MSERTEWIENARRWLAEFKQSDDYACARSRNAPMLDAAAEAAEKALADLARTKHFSRLRPRTRQSLKYLRRVCFHLAAPEYFPLPVKKEKNAA